MLLKCWQPFLIHFHLSLSMFLPSPSKVQVLYGGTDLFDYEVRRTFNNDMLLAFISSSCIAALVYILTSCSGRASLKVLSPLSVILSGQSLPQMAGKTTFSRNNPIHHVRASGKDAQKSLSSPRQVGWGPEAGGPYQGPHSWDLTQFNLLPFDHYGVVFFVLLGVPRTLPFDHYVLVGYLVWGSLEYWNLSMNYSAHCFSPKSATFLSPSVLFQCYLPMYPSSSYYIYNRNSLLPKWKWKRHSFIHITNINWAPTMCLML